MSEYPIFTPAQIQFILIAQTSICKIDIFWENKYTRDCYCDRCFYTEPLIDKIFTDIKINHSILINPYLITKRCDICSISLSIIDKISNCNVCWTAFCEFVATVPEIANDYNILTEPTVICLRSYRFPYHVIHSVSSREA